MFCKGVLVHLHGSFGRRHGEMTPDCSFTITCLPIMDVMARTLYFGIAISFLIKFTIILPYCEICFLFIFEYKFRKGGYYEDQIEDFILQKCFILPDI
jgi:hypothetical protein